MGSLVAAVKKHSPFNSSSGGLYARDPSQAPAEVQAALRAMEEDAATRMVFFFHGARMQYEGGLALQMLRRVSDQLGNALTTSEGLKVVQGVQAARMLQDTIAEIVAAVQKAIGSHAAYSGISNTVVAAVADRAKQLVATEVGPAFVAKATPFLGLVPATFSFVKNTHHAVDHIVKTVYAGRYAQAVKPGAPQAAADGVRSIFKRKAAYYTTTAATATVDLGSSIATAASAGLSAPADAAAKIATAMVKLIAELTLFAIELCEHVAGENILGLVNSCDSPLLLDESFIADIFPASFNACPLLGAYLLSATPYFNTSDFILLSAGPGKLYAKEDVERIAVKYVNPLRVYGAEIVTGSKFKLHHSDPQRDEIMRKAGLRFQRSSRYQRAKYDLNKGFESRVSKPLAAKWRSLKLRRGASH